MHMFYSCQFVVKAEGNYTRYLHDPDMLVDWSLIEQIVSLKKNILFMTTTVYFICNLQYLCFTESAKLGAPLMSHLSLPTNSSTYDQVWTYLLLALYVALSGTCR